MIYVFSLNDYFYQTLGSVAAGMKRVFHRVRLLTEDCKYAFLREHSCVIRDSAHRRRMWIKRISTLARCVRGSFRVVYSQGAFSAPTHITKRTLIPCIRT